jgi:hypothetical protein
MGAASRPSSSTWDECLDAPPREEAPYPGSGLLSNLFPIRHRLLDQALWRRPLPRRGRRVQNVAGSSHLNASNSNSGADLERQLALRQQNSTTTSQPPSSDGLEGRQT